SEHADSEHSDRGPTDRGPTDSEHADSEHSDRGPTDRGPTDSEHADSEHSDRGPTDRGPTDSEHGDREHGDREPTAAGDPTARGRTGVAASEVAPAAAGPATPAGEPRRALVVAGVTAVVAVPLIVAAVAVRTPRWYPLVDLSQIEMRVRDVGLDHPP